MVSTPISPQSLAVLDYFSNYCHVKSFVTLPSLYTSTDGPLFSSASVQAVTFNRLWGCAQFNTPQPAEWKTLSFVEMWFLCSDGRANSALSCLVVVVMCQWSSRLFLPSLVFLILLVTASLTRPLRLHPLYSSACLIISPHNSKNGCFKVTRHAIEMTAGWVDYSGASLLRSSKWCICWVFHDKWRLLRSCCPFPYPPSIPLIFTPLFIPLLSKMSCCEENSRKWFNYWPQSLKRWKCHSQKCLSESGWRLWRHKQLMKTLFLSSDAAQATRQVKRAL